MLQNGMRVAASDPVPIEHFARQIKPLSSRVFVEIAQDVSQLQCPAERFRDEMGGIARIAKDLDREMADRARDARAIEIEGCKIRGPNVLDRIHLHTGDDSEEIFASKAVALR